MSCELKPTLTVPSEKATGTGALDVEEGFGTSVCVFLALNYNEDGRGEGGRGKGVARFI